MTSSLASWSMFRIRRLRHGCFAIKFHGEPSWFSLSLVTWGSTLALSTLKKIERQTRIAEALVQAAADSAKAALLHAQAVVDRERPWLVITVEPSLNIKNGFTILATKNRGRTPARIIANLERTTIAPDEAHLPETPSYEDVAPGAPLAPIILLTGKSTALKSFSRDDAVGLPKIPEELRRLDTWEDKIFIHGRVTYRDLIAPPEQQIHSTDWCCWYIHGRQKSGRRCRSAAIQPAHLMDCREPRFLA